MQKSGWRKRKTKALGAGEYDRKGAARADAGPKKGDRCIEENLLTKKKNHDGSRFKLYSLDGDIGTLPLVT